ncbi:MAG: glycosyltransferase [Prochlorococcaceae cyanobacterium]
MKPRVSVIVPAFNVEPYLVQCLDSLILQDINRIEVIVVNDGSTDDSGQIAMRYAESYPWVRLINQENRGLSEARNVGMEYAKGEYVGFVDGDDWIHPRMYLHMCRAADKSGADLVITNGCLYNNTTRELRPIQDHKVWTQIKNKNSVFNARETTELFRLDTSACKRLYRRSHLKRLDFRFLPRVIFEDVPAHYKLLLHTDKIALVDRPYYYYRTDRPGRITAISNERLFNAFSVLEEVCQELEASQASIDIWISFLWFQSWILRWLRKQIQPSSRADEFDAMSMELATTFPADAVSAFASRFPGDNEAIRYIALQTSAALGETSLTRARLTPPGHKSLNLGNDPIGFFNKDPNTFMPDVWGWLIIEYEIRSVLDIGCGIGTNLQWFDEYGLEVLGVEGHPRAVTGSLLPGAVVQHDFCTGPWAPDHTIDLCLCTKFAEHVEARFEDNWMAAVEKCRFLLLAAAPPGQGGYHHVNEQPDAYWIQRLESRGLLHQPDVSARLQKTCTRKPATWGRNTLLFFHNRRLRQAPDVVAFS